METSVGSEAGAFDVALRDLRDAVELREGEHARRNHYRILFSRAVFLYFLGVCFGLLILTRAFDVDEFRGRLLGKLRGDAPMLARKVSDAITALDGAYRQEALRSSGGFEQRVGESVGAEAAKFNPLLASVSIDHALENADHALGEKILTLYGAELGHDPKRAIALAHSLHESSGLAKDFQQLSAATQSLAVHDSARDGSDLHRTELVNAVHSHAMETAKSKLISGESGTAH
jgi:hypothetical protein